MQSGAAAATAPLLAKLVKEATAEKGKAGEVARIALHTLASAVLAKAQGGDAAAGGFIASAGTKAFAMAIYGKDDDQLAPDEKMVILNLVSALSAAGGGAVTGNTQGMVSAGNAARVEVENNAFNLVGRTDEKVRADMQKQVDGVDLDAVYGDDQEKKDAYRKGREQGAKEGFKDGIVDVVQSTKDSILHPIDTAIDLWTAIRDYGETYDAIKLSVTQWNELYEYALINDPELAGRMAGSLQGKILGNAGTSVVVAGAIGKAVQKLAQLKRGVGSGSMAKPSQPLIVEEISEIGKKTEIEFGAKHTKRSAGQIIIKKMKQSEAIENLSANGYIKSISKDGTVTVMTKGETVYRFYPASTGGGIAGAASGIPSASVSVNGRIISKLRFPGE